MKLPTKKILGIEVTISKEEESLEEIWKYLQKVQSSNFKFQKEGIKPLIIYTPNPEIINYGQKDANFMRIVNTAQINLPDGMGLVWAMKKLHGSKIDRIAGIDFMLELVNLAAKQSLTIGLIGGRGDLADVTRECLLAKHQNLKIEVFEEPELEITNAQGAPELQITNEEIKEIAEKIIAKKIDIFFVAFGFPKQEYFINELNQQLSIINYQLPIILMAVGGSFDYISGRIPRAPLFMRNMGLEWLYRLIREPWRLFRQLKGATFFLRVAFPYLFPIQ